MRVPICARLLLIHLFLAIPLHGLFACSTPVFRYALERWKPDNYDVMVLHHQQMTVAQDELLQTLRQAANDEIVPLNMTVRTIDLSQPLNEQDQQILGTFDPPAQSPWLLIRYPTLTNTDRPAFSGLLDDETVTALIDSPARRALVERIGAGDSAVWILIESGDNTKDDTAEEVLSQRLKHLETNLTQPGLVGLRVSPLLPPEEATSEMSTDPQLGFSLIRVSRSDPREQVFVSMLINSEVDLYEFEEPIAIPVFGRGRSHYALVGKGINDDNIDQSCQFLCGSCSCEVKAQNPGADMLVRANWDELLPDAPIDHEPLPLLSGLGGLQVSEEQPSSQAELSPSTAPEESPPPSEVTQVVATEPTANNSRNYPIYVSLGATVLLAILVVAIGSFLIRARQTSIN